MSSYGNFMATSPQPRSHFLSSTYRQAPLSCLDLLVQVYLRGRQRETYLYTADAHAHLLEYGFKMQLRLDQARSLSALLDMVEVYASKYSSGSDVWVVGMGWDQTRWSDSDGAFPTAVRSQWAHFSQ